MADAQAPPSRRLSSIDWMRGIVMVLMVVDHAGLAFDGGRFAEDSAATWTAGDPLPALEFSVRWATHLCAPTFLFLAGTALAMMVEKRLAKGMRPRDVDRDMLIRGTLILLVDPLLISLGVRLFTFQVMYAIGVSMIAMVVLRRLPTRLLLAAGLGWMVLGEWLTLAWWDPAAGSSSIPAALVCAWYIEPSLKIIYPALPWLSMMMVGWVFGRFLLTARGGTTRLSPAAVLAIWGLVGLVVFAVVRGLNGYGNMALLRDGDGILQWLHVSKYPPSLTFCALELGLLCLLQAALIVVEPKVGTRPNGVLLVFGQTAFFFYVVHRFVFDVAANWFGLKGAGGMGATFIAAALMLVALYPACRWYRSFKRAHPQSVLRFF